MPKTKALLLTPKIDKISMPFRIKRRHNIVNLLTNQLILLESQHLFN